MRRKKRHSLHTLTRKEHEQSPLCLWLKPERRWPNSKAWTQHALKNPRTRRSHIEPLKQAEKELTTSSRRSREIEKPIISDGPDSHLSETNSRSIQNTIIFQLPIRSIRRGELTINNATQNGSSKLEI